MSLQKLKIKGKINKYILFLSILFPVIVVDYLTKLLITSYLPLYHKITVINNFFNIVHIRNPGSAFGLFSTFFSKEKFLFLVFFSIISIIVIVYFLLTLPGERRLMTSAFSLIAGGAIGNLIDRLRFGEVVDFLDFYIYSFHWPAFNLADSVITFGALIIAIECIRK